MFLECWRILILLLWIWLLVFFFIPSIEIGFHNYMNGNWTYHFNTFNEFLRDQHLEIPVEQRKPSIENRTEFYKQQPQQLKQIGMQNIRVTDGSIYSGSVMLDGRNGVLPNDLMWKNGMVQKIKS